MRIKVFDLNISLETIFIFLLIILIVALVIYYTIRIYILQCKNIDLEEKIKNNKKHKKDIKHIKKRRAK